MRKIALLVLFIFLPINGWACLSTVSIEQNIKSSDVIITGKLINLLCKDGVRKAEFKVKEIWKGDVKEKYVFSENVIGCKDHNYLDVDSYYYVMGKTNENEITVTPSGNTCGADYGKVNIYWYEWNKKTKYRKALLNAWYNFSSYAFLEKNWFKADVLSYWNEVYYKLGKPKHIFKN